MKVPLGVILKSETKTEEMVNTRKDLHTYVPTTTANHAMEVPEEDREVTVTEDHFHHLLFGVLDCVRMNHLD